jgi:hypothetical protein
MRRGARSRDFAPGFGHCLRFNSFVELDLWMSATWSLLTFVGRKCPGRNCLIYLLVLIKILSTHHVVVGPGGSFCGVLPAQPYDNGVRDKL